MLFWVMMGLFLRPLTIHGYILLTPASEPHAFSDDYMDWFMRISHPFITPGVEDDESRVPSRRRSRSPADRDPRPSSGKESSELFLLSMLLNSF